LHIVDPVAARKLRYGAKWGVSPTIDAEKLVRDGKKYALDPKFISCSLVLRPAVRETMLNEDTDERRSKKCMEEDKEKLREIEELAVKKKKKEEEEMTAENKELKSKIEKYETAELERKSNEVLSSGVGFGILTEDDLSKLMELSDSGREFVSEVIDRVATTLKLKDSELSEEDLSAYTAFVKKFMKEKKGATIADAAKAWKKGKGKLEEENLAKKEKYPYPYPEKKPKGEMGEAQERMKAELSEEQSRHDFINRQMLDFMQEQQR